MMDIYSTNTIPMNRDIIPGRKKRVRRCPL